MAASTDQADRSECTPCRGTGTLNSNKGGEPHQVECPWCRGTGTFEPGRDAQAEVAARAQASQP